MVGSRRYVVLQYADAGNVHRNCADSDSVVRYHIYVSFLCGSLEVFTRCALKTEK